MVLSLYVFSVACLVAISAAVPVTTKVSPCIPLSICNLESTSTSKVLNARQLFSSTTPSDSGTTSATLHLSSSTTSSDPGTTAILPIPSSETTSQQATIVPRFTDIAAREARPPLTRVSQPVEPTMSTSGRATIETVPNPTIGSATIQTVPNPTTGSATIETVPNPTITTSQATPTTLEKRVSLMTVE